MVRPPYRWGWHPQAARRETSKLEWLPGRGGTGMQPIRSLPVRAYTAGKIQGVPLTGGQGQAAIQGFATTTGTATAPAAFTTMATITVPPGTYTASWSVTLSGTPGGADANNFVFKTPAGVVVTSVNAGAAGTYMQAPVTFTSAPGANVIFLQSGGNAATAGAVYSETVFAASLQAQVTVGPQGLGTIWYPAQATVSTTTGVLDTSTCSIYLGPNGVPNVLVAQIYTGNGVAALAIPSMTPGQYIIAVWTGGHTGDIAAINVIGTMDALHAG